MSGESSKRKSDLEWERRVLCSDEACIGTIGADGTCRECGKPYDGQLPDHFDQPVGEEDGDAAEPPSADDLDVESQADDEDGDTESREPGDDTWEQRTLCSDGNCIGIIGPDGRCKECGLPYEG